MEHSNKSFFERGAVMCDENLIVIAGPSGAGKTDVVAGLKKQLCIKKVISSTTRNPRPSEVDGIDYNFYSHKQFLLRVDDGEFLESAPYEGNLYGTRFEDLNRALESDDLVLFVVEMKGVELILRHYPGAQTFFITAPKEQLVRRINERAADEDERKKRIEGLDKDLLGVHSCLIKHIIHNPDGCFEETLKSVRETILSKVGYSYIRKEK